MGQRQVLFCSSLVLYLGDREEQDFHLSQALSGLSGCLGLCPWLLSIPVALCRAQSSGPQPRLCKSPGTQYVEAFV